LVQIQAVRDQDQAENLSDCGAKRVGTRLQLQRKPELAMAAMAKKPD